MNIPIAENPRGGLPRWAIKQAGGINKRAWALARRGKGKRRARRRNPVRARKHRRAFTGTVARPALARRGKGVYGRTTISKRRYSGVRLVNPLEGLPFAMNRSRRHRRRNNPALFSVKGLSNRVMDGAKTTAGVLVVNGLTNYLFTSVIPASSISTNEMVQKALKGVAKIAIAQVSNRYVGRYIGTQAARDMVTVVTVMVILDFVLSFLKSSPATADWANYLGLIVPDSFAHFGGHPSLRLLSPDESTVGMEYHAPYTAFDEASQGG